MTTVEIATWRARALKLRNDAFIVGRLVDDEGGQTFATINQTTGRKLADATACRAIEFDAAVVAARRAYEAGVRSGHPARERKRVSLRLSRRLRVVRVSVNCNFNGDISVPFRGVKQSGFGRGKSLDAPDLCSDLKITWITRPSATKVP